MTDDRNTTDWLPPDTAPTNGFEFEYLCDDNRIRRCSLGENVKRDPRMIGWRPIEPHDVVVWRDGGYRSVAT